MTTPSTPAPEVIEEINYIEETRKILAAGFLPERNENPVELLKSLCSRIISAERCKVLDEVETVLVYSSQGREIHAARKKIRDKIDSLRPTKEEGGTV